MKKKQLFILGVVSSMLLPCVMKGKPTSSTYDAGSGIRIFGDVVNALNTFYVDTIDMKKNIENAINGFFYGLDPYVEYVSAEDASQYVSSITSGEYGGIGSVVTKGSSGVVELREPYEGMPAAEAGLQSGDRIVGIDTFDTRSWDVEKVSKHLRGEAGTTLTLRVVRPYVSDSIREVTLKRGKIQMPTVNYYTALSSGVGYISLESFKESSPEEVKNAILDLKNNHHITSLILDLRGNGGGLLESAIEIVNFFVPKNTEVLRTRGRAADSERIYKTVDKALVPDMPLCVMVDEASASASEVVTGALQDLDRAVVVGSRTFGKGLVQNSLPIARNSLLKFTSAKYYLPSGRLIQALDYSHRDEEGNVMRTPDSLTNVYLTRNKREVRDGGGITPDSIFDKKKMSTLVYQIVYSNIIYDYSTRYHAEHPEIASAEEFVVDDALWSDFKSSINAETLKYGDTLIKAVDDLRDAVDDDGLLTDSVSNVLAQLKELLRGDLDADLDRNRESIEPLLAVDIVMRYYYERGIEIQSMKYDSWIPRAAAIVSDETQYKKILSPNKK